MKPGAPAAPKKAVLQGRGDGMTFRSAATLCQRPQLEMILSSLPFFGFARQGLVEKATGLSILERILHFYGRRCRLLWVYLWLEHSFAVLSISSRP